MATDRAFISKNYKKGTTVTKSEIKEIEEELFCKKEEVVLCAK
jgi:hypothetical protein